MITALKRLLGITPKPTLKQPLKSTLKQTAGNPLQIEVEGALTKCFYRLLDLEKSGQGIFVGYLDLFSVKGAFEAVANLWLSRLDVVLNYRGLSPQNRAVLERKKFMRYAEFLDSVKDKEDFLYKSHSTDEEGYREYLQENAPHIVKYFKKRIPVYLPEKDRLKHSFVTGKSGSGKSELLKSLIYPYVQNRGYATVIVIDPHGDLTEQVAKWRENRDGKNLVYVNPVLDSGFTPVMNPFDLPSNDERQIEQTAVELCAVFEELLKGEGTGLTLQMKTVLMPCLSTLLRLKNANFRDLQVFMNDEQNEQLIKEGLKSPNENHRFFFEEAFQGERYKTTKNSIYTKLQFLLGLNGFKRILTGRTTLNLQELLNSRKLIVFNLAVGNLTEEVSSVVGRFILASIQSLVLQRTQTQRVPVHLFIDECQNYITDSIEKILTQARKFGLHVTLAQQILGQGMNEKLKKTVLSCTETKLTGRNSYSTLSPMARETGVKYADLQELKEWHFGIKSAFRPPFNLLVPDRLIDNKNAMSPQEWETVKKAQLKQYYRPVVADSFGKEAEPADQSETSRKPKYELP